MKKLVVAFICFSIVAQSVFAQQRTPQTPSDPSDETPQYNDSFKSMEQMQGQIMSELQKMFGGKNGFQMGDSSQTFGFQQFKLPFGEMDSTMMRSFGFSFGDNGGQFFGSDNGDSTSGNFQQLQEQMKQVMPMFEQLFQGKMPNMNQDPSVIPPMDKQKPKSNKKYKTEKL